VRATVGARGADPVVARATEALSDMRPREILPARFEAVEGGDLRQSDLDAGRVGGIFYEHWALAGVRWAGLALLALDFGMGTSRVLTGMIRRWAISSKSF